MKIKKIKVGGFKNILNCEIDLKKIIGLLSVNSYGKSNLLKSIEFGIDFITLPSKIKNNMMGWKKGIPKNKNINAPEFQFEITLIHTTNDSEYEVKYGFSFTWRLKKEISVGVKNEYLLIKENSKKQKFSYYIKRENGELVGKYKASEFGRCDKKINIKSNELIINKLYAYDSLFYADIIEEINDFDIYIDRHLDSSNAFDLEPIIHKDIDDLKLVTADNIPRTLFKLHENYKEKYEYLIDIYKQLFPRIEDIRIRQFKLSGEISEDMIPDISKISDEYQIVDYLYMIFCKEYNMSTEINFQEMSDGARRILLLLTNLILADINNISLFCIEEPENSINPSLFRNYIEIINDLSDKTKIIITSHSPYLIDYLSPEQIYIGCNNEKGIVDFRKIKKSTINKLYKDSSSLNMGYGEYLFDLFSDSSEEINNYVK